MSKGKNRRIKSAKPKTTREETQQRLEEAFGKSYPPEGAYPPEEVPDVPFDDGSAPFSPLNMPDAPLDLLGRKRQDYNPVQRRITVLEDHELKLPELWLTVFVFGPSHEAGPFAKMFARAKCYQSDTPDGADLVVFAGGEDVDPALYGEKAHPSTCFSTERDKQDIELYKFCESRGIPMFGVCRGAQFLHVMNGGKLFQDVNNHNSAHTMYDRIGKELLQRVSSVHHQMVRQNVIGGMEIIATSSIASKRWMNDKEFIEGSVSDVEAFWYRDTCCLGIQGHPEYAGYNHFTQWSLMQLDHYLNENPDLQYRPNGDGTNKLRIKEELMLEREARKVKIEEMKKKTTAVVTIPSEDMIIVEQKQKG
jgi:gamma-glutamyl-gamma-aminobutyrate hydrolase PuuD